ncbi:uncharacterized protein AC631_02023 [Debaryomyces fabryi]|uniref:Calcineurin-like phosphoesterase domain-containing protein n=1 Tax=Debaryomyces fabryi TaxID=58627 RepID=A0A0V1Q109_9ASCO|nr:uncharacterized protein AC631_02023 [Debaryomyces fabryi]KSA02205.1 hypothetical protein AC631_02023 [Debaryomyces fabryi]CUM46569.1 unnamed protein product [Debaryomyces fabryi]
MSHRRKEKTDDILPLHLNSQDKHDFTYKPRAKSQSDIIKNCHIVKWKILTVLTVIWIVIIHYFERISVRLSMEKCQWQNWEGWDKAAQPHRIALIADPQIVDDSSYQGRPAVLNYFVKKISDNYLHRNYRFLQEYLDPDTIIFLGDLFDGGRDWKNKMWLDEYIRFNEVFPKKPNRRTIESLPGNHDIGFETIDFEVVKRFAAFFGEANDIIEIGNHSIILLDTISLSSDDPLVSKDSTDFLSSLDQRLNPHFPRVLLTHVPLYRSNDKQLCGPYRESNKLFPIQKGKQYQTVIEFGISQQVLSIVKPDIVFSGDDHDYCDVRYSYDDNGSERFSREITVKSASMTCGIQYPAIQLLSLHNPYNLNPEIKLEKPKHVTEMCYLPKPYFALKMYVFLFICTLFILAGVFFQSLFNLLRFEQLKLKRNDDYQLTDNRWKPQKDLIINNLNKRRNIGEFFINGLILSFLIYVLFGIYYKFI